MKKWFLKLSDLKKVFVYLGFFVIMIIAGNFMDEKYDDSLISYGAAIIFLISLSFMFIMPYWQYKHRKTIDKEKKIKESELNAIKQKETNEINSLEKKEREEKDKIYYAKVALHNKEIDNSFKGEKTDKDFDNYVVLDLETSGFSTKTDEILELCVLRIRNNEIVDSFKSLLNPIFSIDERASKVNKIFDEDVVNAPTPNEIIPIVYDFIGDDVIVAHNASFDMNFLYNYVARYTDKYLTNNYIDTLSLARKYILNLIDYKLKTVARHLKISTPKHFAEADCVTTHELYQRLKQKKYGGVIN